MGRREHSRGRPQSRGRGGGLVARPRGREQGRGLRCRDHRGATEGTLLWSLCLKFTPGTGIHLATHTTANPVKWLPRGTLNATSSRPQDQRRGPPSLVRRLLGEETNTERRGPSGDHSEAVRPHPTKLPGLQFSSVAQSCPTLCDLMDCSTPGLPVHHQLREFTQTHVC